MRVKPGIVLSSLTSTRSESSTKKSTRARPEQPTRTNVSRASRRTSSSTRSGSRAGTTSSIPPRPVLGLVVVPLGALQDDLTGDRGLRLAVADHRALDLEARRKALDDHQRVVPERALERGRDVRLRPCLGDPDRASEPRRLDEHGRAEHRQLAAHGIRLRAPARLAHRRVGDLRHGRGGQHLLEDHLVHAQRRRPARPRRRRARRAARAGPGGPVLAERPVQDAEHHVHAEQAAAGRERQRLALVAPRARSARSSPARPHGRPRRGPRVPRRPSRATRRAPTSARPASTATLMARAWGSGSRWAWGSPSAWGWGWASPCASGWASPTRHAA